MQSEQKTTDDQPPKELLLAKIPAKYVSYSHTTFGYCAFFFALIVGSYTHYYKIVKNEYYGYPEEWFPSVSAATGDWYPARAIFHIFIALSSGPRFVLVYLWYLLITSTSRPTASRSFSLVLLGVGILRTVTCGGWVYITSSDDHTMHDIAMISYLVLTIPWMFGVLATSPRSAAEGLRYRRYACWAFFGAILPMAYFFIEHKVHRVPGAYTNYAFFEWQLILYDVGFDAVTVFEFANFQIAVFDVSGVAATSKAAAGSDGDPNPVNVSESVSQVSETWRLVSDAWAFVADVYLAFVFWSMLTSLALLIWYFPLWNMGISGHEAFLLVTISPLLLGSPTIRSTVYSYRGYFHLLSLAGVASWVIVTPAVRLATTAAGISLSILTWTATWVGEKGRTGTLEHSALVWILGLLLHSVIKMAWWTENPIWPIMHRENGGRNLEGLLLAIVACANVIWRDSTTSGSRSTDDQQQSKKSIKSEGSWPMAAVGFGSLLFAFHSMYSDSSTIMRWVVDGYPNYGPAPVPWGAVTVAALALGVILSSARSFASSIPWFAVGSAACAVFYFFSSWTGYFGGLVLATYLTSVTPLLIRNVAAHPPGRTLFTATMTYNILCLAHVWVVAYAFVPGGVYARERTNWVLSVVMLFIGAGVYNASGVHVRPVQLNIVRQARQFARVAVVAILALAAVVAVARVKGAKVPQPWHPELKVFTAAIWTIHFALDNDMWASERRMRDVIRDLELDVIGLLESDTMRIIMGNRDWAQYIAEDLGYYVDFGPATMKHTWGCLMLSKFPILRSSHHLLPSPVGELACAIHATLDVYGQPVDFIVSHNGQEEDELDRKLQTTELARIMRTSPNPFVFLGYVVTKPNGPIYKILFEDGDMNDIDSSDWDRWCEYVGFRGLRRVAYARVSHGRITDTEIQTGKFQVVKDPAQYWKAEYDRAEEWNIPTALRYPLNFRLPGVRNHHYHVFEEPRYWGPKGADWVQVYGSFKVDE